MTSQNNRGRDGLSEDFGGDLDTDTPTGMKSYLSQRLMMAAPFLLDTQETPAASNNGPTTITYLNIKFERGANLISLGGWVPLRSGGAGQAIQNTPHETIMTSLSMVQAHSLDVLVFSGEVCRRHASRILSALRPDPIFAFKIVEIAMPRTFSSHQIMRARAMAMDAKLGRDGRDFR